MVPRPLSPRRPPALVLCLALLAACDARRDQTQSDEPASSAGADPAGAASAEPAASGSPAVSGAPAASGSPAAPTAPGTPGLNVVLITVDSLRADMPWAGYPRQIAPAMTAFAETAVVYDRFYAISSYTAMSLGGLLSGRYPSELERNAYYFAGYTENVVFFPALLQRAGVRTLSAQAHFYFDQRSGFRRVFDAYEVVPGIGDDHQTDENITSPKQLELALGMLSDKANTQGRFFAWFHFLDPHDKYQAHPGIEYGHSTRDLYDGEVTFTDQHIGKLLGHVAAAEWGARTAVIISADHGEGFGERGRFRHGFDLWDSLTHVPLMIRVPGVAPRRIDEPRSAIDLAPTILDLFGLPKDPAMSGASLLPEVRGASPGPRDVILDLPRTSDSDRKRALIRGDLKLLAHGDDDAFQLFDVAHDPREEKDLGWSMRPKLEEMKDAYREQSAKIPSVCPLPTKGVKLFGKKKWRPC